jgi:hypothetical protein
MMPELPSNRMTQLLAEEVATITPPWARVLSNLSINFPREGRLLYTLRAEVALNGGAASITLCPQSPSQRRLARPLLDWLPLRTALNETFARLDVTGVASIHIHASLVKDASTPSHLLFSPLEPDLWPALTRNDDDER